MGNENGRGRLRLSVQPVFTGVLEGTKTFAEMAQKYGLTLKDFEDELRAKVGTKEYNRLKKKSKRNEDGKGEDNMKEPRIKKKPTAATTAPATGIGATITGSKAKNVVTRETLQHKLEDAQREVNVAEENVNAAKALLEAERSKVSEAEENVDSAKKALAMAEGALQEAQKAFKMQEKVVDKKQQAHKAWQDCLANIEQSIRDMDAQLIYLVAPGYKGELPTVGKLISVVPFEGATLEKGEELYKELTVADLLNTEFDTMAETRQAYDFARLVIKYEILDIEVTVLVDDERIKNILRAQEVGF